MRVRVRGPDGTSTLSLNDTATVSDLKSQISSSTGISLFSLKHGYPPQSLDLDQFDDDLKLSDTGLKLNGEQLTVSPNDVAKSLQQPLNDPPAAAPAPVSHPKENNAPNQISAQVPPRSKAARNTADSDPPEIPLPLLEGTLVLRVMPDDNSCLFRALSYAVLGDFDSMHELRGIVATQIQAQPDLYSAAVLENSPNDYCKWIMREDSWGGGIELGILSQHFECEISSINVQDLRTDRFNEGRPTRCILVYSGIHYDVIVLNRSFPPYDKANAPPEQDVKVFDSDNEAAITGALELCKKLQSQHYYTDTAGFLVTCGDCGWSGNGEKAAIEHASTTGHYNFGEAQDR